MYKKRSFTETLRLLCLLDKSMLKNSGVLNVAAAAREVGLKQPTMKRMLDGDYETPSPDNADKLTKHFGISLDQLYGLEPIPDVDGSDALSEAKELSRRVLNLDKNKLAATQAFLDTLESMQSANPKT